MGIHPVSVGCVEFSLVRNKMHDLGATCIGSLLIEVSCIVALSPLDLRISFGFFCLNRYEERQENRRPDQEAHAKEIQGWGGTSEWRNSPWASYK